MQIVIHKFATIKTAHSFPSAFLHTSLDLSAVFIVDINLLLQRWLVTQ